MLLALIALANQLIGGGRSLYLPFCFLEEGTVYQRQGGPSTGLRRAPRPELGTKAQSSRSGHPGRVEVICGSMFSRKTEELIRRVRRAQIARQKVQVFKPRWTVVTIPCGRLTVEMSRSFKSPKLLWIAVITLTYYLRMTVYIWMLSPCGRPRRSPG